MARFDKQRIKVQDRIHRGERARLPSADLLEDWPSLRARIPVASDPDSGPSRPETLPVEVQGEERWLSISAVRFAGGTVYAFRDVTDERAVEQMKTDFVSTVSHELRTPLAAIYGAAMTLRRHDVAVEESQRERLLEVVSSVWWAWLLLDELPGAAQLFGGVLILAGVVAVKLGEKSVTVAEPVTA